ncbi:MAG: hypothetical protein PVF69_13615, partial [Gemmatimonadota bacterium]
MTSWPMRMVLKGVLTAAVWAVALSASVDRVQAQDYRGWTTSSVQMVELRPLGLDTVSSADVEATSDGRFLYDGLEVTCAPGGTCTGYLPLDV